MRKILWAPGYLFIALMYFFPTEWGKKRNVAASGRWWRYQDALAPIISLAFYIFLAFKILLPDTAPHNAQAASENNSPSNSVQALPIVTNDQHLIENHAQGKMPEDLKRDSLPAPTQETAAIGMDAEKPFPQSAQQETPENEGPKASVEAKVQYIPGHE